VLKQVSLEGGTDEVAVELPLEIRLNGSAVAVTMRTPGHDFELAAGFLYGEGIVSAAPDMQLPEDLAANIVDARAPDAVAPATRRFYTTSSCGICGKGALEEVEAIAPVVSGDISMPRALLAELPDRLRQPGFERTGGLHATGLFSPSGELLSVHEDVGRHNAMDKVIGAALLAGTLPLSDRALCVSGRLAFELVQKAARAGAPILVGVGAPTSLAVELAADRGITLAGFARGGRVNVYTHAHRIV
jgi:FdhD protein